MANTRSVLNKAKSLFIVERNLAANSAILKWEDLPSDMKKEYLFLANRQINWSSSDGR